MDWNSLWSDLRSEAIGAVVTVLLVERLLKWQEQRTWRRVREIFLEQAQIVSDKVWADFETWFDAVHAAAQPSEPGWRHVTDVSQWKTNAEAVLTTYEKLYYLAGGDKAKDKELTAYTDTLTDQLNGFLPRPLDTHVSWKTFHASVFPLIHRFEDFVSRYSAVVDPGLALITIRMRRDLDLLETLSVVPQDENDRDLQHRLSGLVASQLLQIARLTRYVLKNRKRRISVWHPAAS